MLPPILSIVVVSFNTRDLLRRCLASIVESPHHAIQSTNPLAGGSDLKCEVTVVDNGSSDGSVEMVINEFPMVHLLQAGRNLGFARATNWGLRESRGEQLMLLNPDTEVIGDALVAMATFLRHGPPNLAAVSPTLLYPDGEPQQAAFRFPTLWMSFFDFFPLNHRLVNSGLNGRYPPHAGDTPRQIDHPLGAAMVLRREAVDQVGLLDEAFFMYCEEVDWCLRARKAGWTICQLPGAKVLHHAGQSSRQFRHEMLVELHRSRYRLFRKHYSASFVWAHRAVTRLGLTREWAAALWQARTGQMSRDELDQRIAAYRAIWRM